MSIIPQSSWKKLTGPQDPKLCQAVRQWMSLSIWPVTWNSQVESASDEECAISWLPCITSSVMLYSRNFYIATSSFGSTSTSNCVLWALITPQYVKVLALRSRCLSPWEFLESRYALLFLSIPLAHCLKQRVKSLICSNLIL